MLVELAVRDLGVIAEVSLVLGPRLTALTGETGAGKTMVVEAIELLMGGRADGSMVRSGADEAVIEGRFVVGDDQDEVVVRRVVPREGRSRAYVNGRLATVSELAEQGRRLVDLHGQHAHQSLLSAGVQRAALDQFGGIDLEPLVVARKELASVDERLAALGGDERERAREIDLLRFQVDEIDGAAIAGVDEDRQLESEEEVLGHAVANREGAAVALAALTADGGAGDGVAQAIGAIEGRAPFAAVEARLRAVSAELADLATDVRAAGEAIVDDPERVEAVRLRRKLLHDLRRKYGESLADVLAYREEVAARLAELESRDATAAELDGRRAELLEAVAAAEATVLEARRRAGPDLAAAVERNLAELALEKARVEVSVEGAAGDEVVFLLAANPGSPPLPLAKVASGGELARTMLALRLVLSQAPDTLVFDEVDAGIGGTAATAVGRSLATLGIEHQVLVVTHLAQVAASADHHVVVSKQVRAGQTFTSVGTVAGDDRVVEVARMLSGSPDSGAARRHAQELLDGSNPPV
jgi:DNA repair protein RecN (Recombination protein N)